MNNTSDSLAEKPLKKAKEHKRRSILYCHECPYCGDECGNYDVSVVGDILDCVCGEKYEVVR